MILLEAFKWINIPYTILFGLTIVYWISVLLGLMDIEFLDFDIEPEGFLGILNIGNLPFSIWLSVFAFQAWIYSIVMNIILSSLFTLPGILQFLITSIVIISVALFATKIITYPLKRLFQFKSTKKEDFIGTECRITSTTADHTFGLAEITIDGVPQILDVRTNREDILKQGEKALITEFDQKEDLFYISRI